MRITELTDAECEAVLERAVVARLATCADDRPYIVADLRQIRTRCI